MRTRLTSLLAAAVVAAACDSDPTGPGGPTSEVTLDLCGGFGISWMGIQNQGQGWQQVNIASNGTATFQATEKVSVALVLDFFGSTFTQVLNTTAAELSQAGAVACEGLFGDRSITGTVIGLTGEQVAEISGVTSYASATTDFPDFELTDLPNTGTVDLVAVRAQSVFTQPPDRVIVRRGVTPSATGQPISPLDFASEGQALQSANVTLENVGSDQVIVESAFMTENGTIATLGELSGQASAFGYVSIPAALRSSTDIHSLWALASSPSGDRTITFYYANPSNVTLAFGPQVSAPTVSEVATSPYLRVRATLPSQPEYADAAAAEFFQAFGEFSFKAVVVITTAAHAGGTPSSWTLEIPDFGASGYQSSWGLANDEYEWSVTAFDGDALFSATELPPAGTTLRSATRTSGTGFARLTAACAVRGSRLLPGPRPSGDAAGRRRHGAGSAPLSGCAVPRASAEYSRP